MIEFGFSVGIERANLSSKKRYGNEEPHQLGGNERERFPGVEAIATAAAW